MHESNVLVTDATSDPVTLEATKAHLRVETMEDDALIEDQISHATRYIQDRQKRQLMQATYRYCVDYFPGMIKVPRPPLSSVTSLKYYDTDGVLQTLVEDTDFEVDTDAEPGRIIPYYGTTWPTTRQRTKAVQLTYVAGYASAAVVPKPTVQAILLLVGHWYENRESVVVGTISKEIEFAVNALADLNAIIWL